MSTAEVSTAYTPDEFLDLTDSIRFELVDGELVERNMGCESAWIGGRLLVKLSIFSDEDGRGWVMGSEATYQCYKDDTKKVRRPDVSFIRFGRLPDERIPVGHIRIPPDLAVEVVSPRDTAEALEVKVEEYLAAGVPVVWVVNPATRTVMIYRADGSSTRLRESDELTGEGALEGFTCPVVDIFPPAHAAQ